MRVSLIKALHGMLKKAALVVREASFGSRVAGF
jgi:hypothetical protein